MKLSYCLAYRHFDRTTQIYLWNWIRIELNTWTTFYYAIVRTIETPYISRCLKSLFTDCRLVIIRMLHTTYLTFCTHKNKYSKLVIVKFVYYFIGLFFFYNGKQILKYKTSHLFNYWFAFRVSYVPSAIDQHGKSVVFH